VPQAQPQAPGSTSAPAETPVEAPVEASAQTKTITIPTGTYKLSEINKYIQKEMKKNRDWDESTETHYITLAVNTATLKTTVTITNPNFTVDMVKTTLRNLFGFSPRVLSQGYHEGDKPMDIIHVNSILVHCDIISGSYIGSTSSPVLYSFYPDAAPGEKIVEKPQHLVYLPVTLTGNISGIRIWLTDQDENPLDLRGEKLTIRCELVAY